MLFSWKAKILPLLAWRQTRRSWRATNWKPNHRLMPKPKVLSGAEVVRILASFAFDVASQRGSHIKLRRALPDGARQPLPFRITVNWIAARCSESTASPAIRSGRGVCSAVLQQLSMLDFSLHSREMDASAGAWNFGLCATRSREPRQARKGATVPGSPRVPQTTRSSSH